MILFLLLMAAPAVVIIVTAFLLVMDCFARCADDAARSDKDADWEDYNE